MKSIVGRLTFWGIFLGLFGMSFTLPLKAQTPTPKGRTKSPSTAFQLPSTYALRDEFTRHPLDTALLYCMEVESPGTSGETECLRDFAARWEAEREGLSQALIQAMGTDAAAIRRLRSAERRWQKFAQAEFALIKTKYRNDDGTMYPRMEAYERLMLIRHRALELTVYLARQQRD